VTTERYMLVMLKHLSARGNLFLFVRRHHHLEYYFNLGDSRFAANETALLSSHGSLQRTNVFEIHPLARAQRRLRRQ
jgi:hypothetical protein